jgi:hypothetical protein
MLVKSWEQIPFATGVNNLVHDKSGTDLPFEVSCGTQQGIDHFENSIGNQDAISIIIENDFLIGIICDGCTSSNIDSVNEFTANQVGANLLSKKVGSLIRKIIETNGVSAIQESLEKLKLDLLKYINNQINELSDSNLESQLLLNNFFTTTITILAIDKEDYCVLNSGDGLIYLNNKKKELKFSPNTYLTSYIESNEHSNSAFNVVEFGKSTYLESVFMSTDGFESEKILGNSNFIEYLNKKSTAQKRGYIDGLPEFRQMFLTPLINEENFFGTWPNDDASFIIVRRVTYDLIHVVDGDNSMTVIDILNKKEATNASDQNTVANNVELIIKKNIRSKSNNKEKRLPKESSISKKKQKKNQRKNEKKSPISVSPGKKKNLIVDEQIETSNNKKDDENEFIAKP